MKNFKVMYLITGGNTENYFGRLYYQEFQSQLWLSTHKKQLRICIEYRYICEFMVWLYRGNFVKIKWVKIPSLAALQVAKLYEKISF